MRRESVLHIITRLDPGGSAENTVLSAERVAPDRYDSRIWTGPGLTGAGPPAEYRRRLAGRLEVLPHLLRPVRPARDLVALIDLARRLRRERPSILHLHSAKAGALGRVAAMLGAREAKVVYTPHGHVFAGYGGETASRLFTRIEKGLAPWADAIVGLTTDEVRAFLEVGAGQPEQFCVIPSGVDLSPFHPLPGWREEVRKELGIPPEAPVVGFVGRLAAVKGPDIFLEVAANVLGQNPDVRFVVIGDGELSSALKRRAKKYWLDKAILWTGWREDPQRMFAALDLLALTSRNEGQGRVLVEAMAAGVPAVAMATGGVPEVIADGETGVLVPAGDVVSASKKIVDLLAAPERRRAMAAAGRKRARERFSLEVMIRRLERLYDGLLAGRKPAEILPAD